MKRRILTGTRSEVLSLYRKILRTSKLLDPVKSETGESMGHLIRVSARTEIEDARYESDPKRITEMILVGNDCLQQTQEKIAKELHKMGAKTADVDVPKSK